MPFRIPFLDKFPVRATVYQKRGKGLSVFYDRARFIKKHGIGFYELKKYGAPFKPSSFNDFVIGNNGKPHITLYEYQRGLLVPVSTADLEELYDVGVDGRIIYEDMNYRCELEHYFNKPVTTKEGTLKKKNVERCPICSTHIITKLPETQKRPKIKSMINLHSLDEDMVFWGQMRRWQSEERHKNQSFLQKYAQFIMMALMFVFCIALAYIFMQNISDNANNVVTAMQGMVGKTGAAAATGAPPG